MRPCPGCRRHVRADEATCPFCAAVIDARGAVAPRSARMTRAAVFVAGAALAGCGGKAPPDPQPPDPVSNQPEVTQTPDAAPVTTPPDPIDEPDRPDHPIPAPYGAPPRRERIV
jgi:hypothetical protein